VPTAAVPSRSALEALHSALQATLAGERTPGAPSDDLQRAVCAICEEAHGAGLPAERMLALFKAALHASPEVRRLNDRRARDELLSRVVSLCIREYYAPRS
jgi:hypothetical protein